MSARFEHPGIVSNMFFLWRRSKEDSRELEFVIVSELMEGGHLGSFMSSLPDKKLTDLTRLKHICIQII
jgi:hypothetical protein